MSRSPAVAATPPEAGDGAGVRRVRHQARDVLLLMAFSAGTSVGLAALMLLLLDAGR